MGLRDLPAAAKRVLKQPLKKLGIDGQTPMIPAYYLPYVFLDGEATRAPLQCDFEVTFRCNMYCDMCPQVVYRERELEGGQITASPVDGDRAELSTAEITRCLTSLAQGGNRSVLFSGGEPFLRQDMVELLACARRLGLRVHLITNGSMITEKIARGIVDAGVDGMTFSLDGPQETHDAIRKLPRGFEKLSRGVSRILEERRRRGVELPRVSLSAVIHALNQHVLADIVGVARDLGVAHVNYNYLFWTSPEAEHATRQILHGRRLLLGVKPEDQQMPPELRDVDVPRLVEEIEKVHARAAEYGVHVTFEPNLRGDGVRRRFEDPSFSIVHRCFYPWKAMRVDAWGNVYPCSVDVHFGNVRQEDVLAIWNNDRYREFRRKLKTHDLFPQCPMCCMLIDTTWNQLPKASARLPGAVLPVLRELHRLA